MTLADNIYQHSRRLPDRAAHEALDFIEFLEWRYGTLGDDLPDDITDNDLGVDIPREEMD